MSESVVTVIEPRRGWKLINFREMAQYKDLFYFLVLRDITVLYKQTILGFAWAILNPLFTMVVFTVVFGTLANVSSDGVPYPIFSFAALVPWTYFAQSLTSSTTSLITSSALISKVYFPRLFIPLTPVIAKLVDFAIAFVFLIILSLFYGIIPSWQLVYLPLLVLLMVMTSAGIGMWLSALAIQYRDVRFAIQFLVQLLMYVAPVVWSITAIEQKLVPVYGYWIKLVYGLYPMAGVIEGFRSALLGKAMPWDMIGVGIFSALVIFISGILYFRKTERVFADVA